MQPNKTLAEAKNLDPDPEIHPSRIFDLILFNSATLMGKIKPQPHIGVSAKFIQSAIAGLGNIIPAAKAESLSITTFGNNVTPLEALGAVEKYNKPDALEIGSEGFKEIFTANKTWFSLSQVIRILLMCQGSKPAWNAFFSSEGSTSFILKGEKGKMRILVVNWKEDGVPTLNISRLGYGRGYNKGSHLVIPIAKPSHETPKE